MSEHDAVRDAYNEETRRERVAAKEAVIAELRWLQPNTQGLGEKVKALREKLYACGSCGHDENLRLKGEFDEAAQALFDARDRMKKEAIKRKEEIVREAESLSYSTEFKEAKERMKDLQEQWKQAPRGAKADEDALWERLHKASDRLFTNAKEDREKRLAQQQDARRKKEDILARMDCLLHTSDLRAATDEMKRLSDEFYNAGSAGRDFNQGLMDRFKEIKDRFYSAKKLEAEKRHNEYMERLQERLDRKHDALDRIENAIRNKEDQLRDLLSRPDPGYNNPRRFEIAAQRNARESQINSALADMGRKREEIINEINELRAKLWSMT